jgi:hypothetical protein
VGLDRHTIEVGSAVRLSHPTRTLTDRVIGACTRALEARRPMLDAVPDGLASVGLVVTLDKRGHVVKVLVRSEALDDLTS